MDLSIVIVNYQTPLLVKYQLRNILQLKTQLSFEIIVVDNDSRDGSAETVTRDFPGVNLIKADSNRGYAAGNNLGLHRSQGKYILILNPDITILDAADLERLVAFMEEHPQVGIAGPKLCYPTGELQESCSRWPNWTMPIFRRTALKDTAWGQKSLANYFYREWDHNSNRKVDWLFGAALIVRKEALIKVGLMDENFFLYLEDTDWSRRFWNNGYEVWYVAEAKFIHYHKRESADANWLQSLFYKSSREHIKSFFKYMRKYRGKSNPNN